MNKREILINAIEERKFEHEATKDNIKNFIKLFLINGSSR